MDDCVGKARGLLNSCRTKGDFWTVLVKLAIFRAFIRSVTEYGAPLFFAWASASPACQLQWETLESLYRDAMQWILPMATHWKIASCVLGIVTPRKRFEGLSANFTNHLERMATDHIARSTLADWRMQMPWPSTVLLPRMDRVPLAALLHRQCVTRKTTWLTELRRWYGECLTEQSTLGKVIDRSCRTSPCGSDRVIFIGDSDLLKLALAWRCNSFAWRRQCIGEHRFVRSCVNKCLQPRYPQVVPELTTHHGYPDHFCWLDVVLNLQEYQIFGEVATWILSLVGGMARGPRSAAQEDCNEED